MTSALSVVVVGASGDLAKKKTYPALLDLFSHGHLPMDVTIVGVARSALTDDSLREQLRPFLEKLSGGGVSDSDSAELIDLFLARCSYRQMKSYADLDAMTSLDVQLKASSEAAHPSGIANRLFYFAIPPNVFLDTAATIKACAVSASGFTRLIVEKPFGHDLLSAQELAAALGAIFDEDRIYRIDHYLGKEMVQNMIVMRFGNVLFRNMWDRRSVASVQITFKEDFGTMGRGGYFDNYGIIRDIMQNHLMQVKSNILFLSNSAAIKNIVVIWVCVSYTCQVMALVAMEEPSAVFGPESGKAVRDSKVSFSVRRNEGKIRWIVCVCVC
jgi:glucose-6-phosphate 1-dehydrogenase